MCRPRPAKGHQFETARILSLLDDVDPGGPRHVLAHDPEHTPGSFRLGQLELPTEPCQRRVGVIHPERHRPPEKVRWVEVAERQAGVGHGGFRTAQTVTGRSRIGPGTARSDLEQAQAIRTGNRTTTGSDLDHVHHRRFDRQAGTVLEAVHPGRFDHRGGGRLAPHDQACLGGGTTHIERKQVRHLQKPPQEGADQRAAGRTRLQEADRELAGGIRAGRTTARLHQVEAPRKALPLELSLQVVEVARHQRLHVGVADRRGIRSYSRISGATSLETDRAS